MSIHSAIRGMGVAACVAIGMLLFTAGGAFAANPSKALEERVAALEGSTKTLDEHSAALEGKAAASESKIAALEGKAAASESKIAALEGKAAATESKVATLEATLKGLTRIESGVAGKPTIQFSGVNVQIVNGEGKTASTNGAGNLVIGYDENGQPKEASHLQTGSHNLILGEQQTFTSYGGILGGYQNTISGPFASVTGGDNNVAGKERDSVSGGESNVADGIRSSISGGWGNHASGVGASISGGRENLASGGEAWIGGGTGFVAAGPGEAIL